MWIIIKSLFTILSAFFLVFNLPKLLAINEEVKELSLENEETISSYQSSKYLPLLGLGTAGLGSRSKEVIIAAMQLGVRLIDTAQAQEWYDENAVGRAARVFVHDYPQAMPIIVTKIHPRSYAIQEMKRSLTNSLNNFEGIGLAGVLLHAPFCWQGHCRGEVESWQQAWRNLEDLKDSFNITYIGVSNFDFPQMEELVLHHANRKVHLVQNWMDPLHQDREVRVFCREHNIQYMAYSSFGTQWEGSRRHISSSKNPVLSHPVLIEIAERKGWSVPQVILAWLREEEVVALPRSTRNSHLADNFKICKSSKLCSDPHYLSTEDQDNTMDAADFRLTEQEVEQIRALDGTQGLPWD